MKKANCQDTTTKFLSIYDTSGPVRPRRKRTVPWEGLQGAGTPEVTTPKASHPRSTSQVENQSSVSADQPDDSCQTSAAPLPTLTSAEIEGYPNGLLRIHRDAGGRHIAPFAPSNTSGTPPCTSDMGTIGAIPHVIYIPRRSNFLADDVSSIGSSSTASQTPRPSAHYIPWPVAPRQPDFGYDRSLVEQTGRLEQLRLQRLMETSKQRFEHLWSSAKAKTEGLENVLRSQLREFRG
jgi:hypothetical protein